MYEVINYLKNISKNLKLLQFRRFYNMSHIIRSVYLVLANQECTKYYVSNFIN